MLKGPYVKITGVVEVEVSALTGAGNIGNYNMHATARIVHGDKVYEVPVMTGNALKHWHAYYMAQVYRSLGGSNLNEFCEKGIGLRGYTVESKLNNPTPAGSELDAIKDLCNDVHGFLIPERQIRRDSLVRFSFAIPVLNDVNLQIASKFAITHNRVDPRSPAVVGEKTEGKSETRNERKTEEKAKAREERGTEMMIFKQEYSSALYGLSASFDLTYICEPMYSNGQSMCNGEEKPRRVKSAILALIPLLIGAASKQARALPVMRPRDLLAVLADKPIPNLVNGAYPDYVKKSVQIVLNYCKGLGICQEVDSRAGQKTSEAEAKSTIQIYCYSERGLCEKAEETNKYLGLILYKDYSDFSKLISNLALHAENLVKQYKR